VNAKLNKILLKKKPPFVSIFLGINGFAATNILNFSHSSNAVLYLVLFCGYLAEKSANVMHHEEIRAYCLLKPGVEECFPFDETTLVFKVGGKMFLLLSLDANPPEMNVKCEPEKALELRGRYDCVQPGYHMSKKHWNTVSCDGSLPRKIIFGWINDSYELVLASLPKDRKPR
jgi:predicted DNA-binding protein (MmcQ/YjbR family)